MMNNRERENRSAPGAVPAARFVPAALLPPPSSPNVPSGTEQTVPSASDKPLPDMPETEHEKNAEPADFPDAHELGTPLWQVLRQILGWAASGLALLFFAAAAVLFLVQNPLTADELPARMLGEVFGGTAYVTVFHSKQRLPPISRSLPLLPSDPAQDVLLEAELPNDDALLRYRSIPALPLRYSNETPYETGGMLERARVIPTLDELRNIWGEDAPLVLILHTHATEAFADCAESGFRSSDLSQNVVSLGAEIVSVLEEYGIPAIHLTALFDEADFTMAYYNAARAIRDTLAANPSVSYIIDVHRDSVESEESLPGPVSANSGEAARMMFVVGTDYGGSGHTGWRDNLALAARLTCRMEGVHEGLMRSLNVRSASFNEQYTSGSLLLEIGTNADSLTQALVSARIFAEALTAEIIG